MQLLGWKRFYLLLYSIALRTLSLLNTYLHTFHPVLSNLLLLHNVSLDLTASVITWLRPGDGCILLCDLINIGGTWSSCLN